MLIFDAHLDLAMNALEWNRDLTRPIEEIRERDARHDDKPDRGKGTVCLPEMRRGGIGLCVATQIARAMQPGVKAYFSTATWHSAEQAWAQTQGQLAWYRAMKEAGEMAQIVDRATLEKHLQLWAAPPPNAPVGYILSLEGADSMITPRYVERSYADGLRAIGPAHYGPGTYAQGTDATGGLGLRGRELLGEMERLNIILDVTHLCDDSFWEALDHFHGPVWASHSNCRALVPHNRQFADPQIRELIARGAVIGAALDAWMMIPNWVKHKTTPQETGLKLERIVDHIDNICQIAGNANHCGIGSDLDGAFGREQSPGDLNTIADLARIGDFLAKRGYSQSDVERIMSGNFIEFLCRHWK
jgi:membrane dipeptidase